MIRTITPIPSLTRWGLSADADLVFRTLSIYGPREAGWLAGELGIGRARLHSALSDLHQAGAVRQSTGAGRKVWCAVTADAALASLRSIRAAHRRHTMVRQLSLEDVTGAVVALGPGLRFLPSREAARVRLGVVTAAARHENLAINPEPIFDAASIEAAGPMERRLQERGVHTRVIGVQPPDPTLLSPHVENTAPTLVYRRAVDLPMKLVVVDRKAAFFPVDPCRYERGYLECCEPTIVESLVAAFERHWSLAAKPLERLMSDFTVSPREEAVIALLVHGHTDATTAARLRISERSVTNIVRSLMDRLGVDNRFQLGVALGAIRAAPLPPGLLVPPATTAARPEQEPPVAAH